MSIETPLSPAPPSFRKCKPTEEGGPIARAGFAYQDHVTALFCLSLLVDQTLTEVWCETYDDIVLIRQSNGVESMEFVQVKAEALDQLWTVAKLCARESGRVGTSIVERSLARAAYKEAATFRLVTLRTIGSDLSALGLPCNHVDRVQSGALAVLKANLEEKFPGVKSPSGCSIDYWVEHVEWHSFTQGEIVSSNKLALKHHLEGLGIYAPTDKLGSIYETLIAKIKGMSELRNVEHDNKVMTRQVLIELLRKADDPFPGHLPSSRLEAKLTEARIDSVSIAQAQELRRAYRKASLSKPFLSLADENDNVEVSILGHLHRLLSSYDSGRLSDASDREFHATCVEQVEGLSKEIDDGTGNLTTHQAVGCMYEITSRCRHRFTKAAP